MLPPSLQLRPSRWILIWLVVIHVLATVAVFLSRLPLLVQGSLLLCLPVSLALAVGFERRRRGEELSPVTLTDWRIRTIKGIEEATLVDVRVFRHVVILCFKFTGRRRRRWMVIAEDAVDADVHRRLRASLAAVGNALQGP